MNDDRKTDVSEKINDGNDSNEEMNERPNTERVLEHPRRVAAKNANLFRRLQDNM